MAGSLALVASVFATPQPVLARPAIPARVAVSPASIATEGDANRALDQLFIDNARAEQALDPLGALERGEPLAIDEFTTLFSRRLVERQRAVNDEALRRLDAIDAASLDEPHRISLAVFRFAREDDRAFLDPSIQALTAVRPLNHFGGFHVEYPGLASSDSAMPYATVDDFEASLGRDQALGKVFDTVIAEFRRGMASGVVESRLTVTNMIAQIDGLLAQPVEDSPFLSPLRRFPADMPAMVRRRLAREYRLATERDVYPAYRRLRRFLAEEYLPAARAAPGISAMPGGDRLYRLLIRHHTTLDLDPAAIHLLGMQEVARIQGEMNAVRQQLGFAGPLPAFFEVVRTDPRYHPRSVAQLSEGFRAIGQRVDALAPRYFRRLPRTPLVIQPYPDFRAKYDAGGSYNPGAPDGSRPGVFLFNTYDLKSRFLTGITTLYLHEAAPGHHFQISLAQENVSLPDFQRFGGNTAYVEGWALYAETLGYEMGMYKDPMQHWGTLDDEMLRAMRLVVDTGIHTKGWSREQAIAFMLANSGMGRSDAAAEVDRYIANPAQALGYKIGALTIQRLRRKAEAELGARFDLRAFHDQVLGSGALPMPVLEAKIDRWIARSKS